MGADTAVIEIVAASVKLLASFWGVVEFFNTTNKGRKKRVLVVQCVEPHANALVFTHNYLAQTLEST